MVILFTFVAFPAILHGIDEIQDYAWKYLIDFDWKISWRILVLPAPMSFSSWKKRMLTVWGASESLLIYEESPIHLDTVEDNVFFHSV